MESKRMEPKQAESETRRRMQDKRLGCLLGGGKQICNFPKGKNGKGVVEIFEIPLSPPQFPDDTEGVNGGREGK
ncbi:UNVERIFIED_CONTAM: hypothetical protein K2H54_058436 [Gekko kuhli]